MSDEITPVLPKLDAKFEGYIRKVKDGTIVPDDEYVVFLAKDDAFFDVLPQYLVRCMERGCDREQIDAVYRMYWRVREWREANPLRTKNPDARGEKLLDLGGAK